MRSFLSLINLCLIFAILNSVYSDETLSIDDLKKLTAKGEKHQFEAEVDKMMKIIINSLYKNKDVFLRELISNASDAIDKIRLLSLQDPKILESNPDLWIKIKADLENKLLIIKDTGIGMTKDELLNNLGTIAKSGTSEFFAKFAAATSEKETSELIGQFGVGFYSAFLIADRVTVISKSNDDDQYIWESDSSSFSVMKDPRGNTLKRGTEIILHLKDEAQDFLKHQNLKEIVKTYSQFINFPIYLWESEMRTVDEEPQEKTDKTDDEVEEEKPEPKKVQKEFWNYAQVNTQKPIWTRPIEEITDQEYNDFFKIVTPYSSEVKLAHSHFKAEGDINFKAILYIPEKAQHDTFSGNQDTKSIIKLYVRKVFITEEMDDIMPKYLSFIRGVVDSEDLPLNVSRETLQQSKLLKLIKKKLVRKIIDMINKMDKEKLEKFWNEYSVNIKYGILEDKTNLARLSKILRFKTSQSAGKWTSLEEYVQRMKPNQDKIFFIGAQDINEAKASPFVERAEKIGYEVIYMTEPIDEHMVQSLTEFDGKRLQNLAKEGVDLKETEDGKAALEAMNKEYEGLMKWLNDDALSNRISKVQVSNRLLNSPCALVASTYGWSGNMQRIMSSQAYNRQDDPNFSYYQSLKQTLEINPRHPLIKELKALVAQNDKDPLAYDTANMLFDTAKLRSGFAIDDPLAFSKRIETIMKKNLDIPEGEVPEEDPNIPTSFEPEFKPDDNKPDYESIKDEL